MLSRDQFNRQIEQIQEVSSRLNDSWEIVNANNQIEEDKYLVKKRCKVELEKELYNLDVHVCYHISYGTPLLAFDVTDSSGQSVYDYDVVWRIFRKINKIPCNMTDMDMKTILTQMDHPSIRRPPIWCFHPCHTSELLENMSESKNQVLTFLTAIGPALGLEFQLEYGQI